MSYKTGRGNAAIFWPRFHALVIMVSDYQQVTKTPVAASRLGSARFVTCFCHPALNKLAWNRDQHFPHYMLIISQLQPSIITNSHANSHVFL